MEKPHSSIEQADMAEDGRQRNMYNCFEDISNHVRKPEAIKEKIEQILSATYDIRQVLKEANDDRRGETWLHAAIRLLSFRSDQEKRIFELIVTKFPKLILQDRAETEYAGQTPLHMGVCKGNIWTVDCMLKYLSKKDNRHWKVTLLKRRATGSIFQNTVMMAELPLFIATLTFNKGMFDLLLDHGAELDAVNSQGDTVCHALIRYAYLYPDKLDDVMDMCGYIKEDPAPFDNGKKNTRNRKLRRKIWLMENRDGLNPLQLAAKLGQPKLFHLIMNLEAYCFENTKDGLFDIKIYDVTEIDSISSMKATDITGIDRQITRQSVAENVSEKKSQTEVTTMKLSVIMMLFDLEPSCAFQFILFPPVRRVIDHKWNQYRFYFYPFWIFHFLFMCFLTWYGVEKSQQTYNALTSTSGQVSLDYDGEKSPNFLNEIPSNKFVTTCGIVGLVIGVLYIAQDIIRILKGRMKYTIHSFINPYGNGTFRTMFVLFGLCLILDFGLSWVPTYENYLLIIALLLGWFLVIFFLRGLRPFSFFTVLIQRVLVGDMFRFFVIIAIMIIAFSTSMYMVIQGSNLNTDTEFLNFGRIVFAMFKLMVGLGEIDMYSVRHPALAILLFTAFIVMTTLLMMNALIAMMSRTCEVLVDNCGGFNIRDMHWKLQRLSLVLFIESILPNALISRSGAEQDVYRYNNEIHRRKKMKRYMLEIRSLQNDAKGGPETFSSSWGFRTAVFNAMGNAHRQRPLSGVSDKIRDFFRRGDKHRSSDDRPRTDKIDKVHVSNLYSKQPASKAPVKKQQQQPDVKQHPDVKQKQQLPEITNTPVTYMNTDQRHVVMKNGGLQFLPRAESTPITQPSPVQVRNVLDVYHVGLRSGRNWSESDLSEY